MMQTLSQLRNTCEQYNSFFKENELCLLQKAYTTPHFLTLSLRFPGKTVVMYIGRGNQYQGIYLEEKMPPSHLRIQDRFLDYVRKYLVDSRISKITCDDKKMLISFNFKTREGEKTFWLGWSERHLYFDQKKLETILDCSLETKERVWGIEDYLKTKNPESTLKVIQKKKEKFLYKKLENIKKDIEKNKSWKIIEEKLQNNLIDLTGVETIVCNEKIKFANCKNEYQKKDQVYKKIKKLKKGEEILLKRMIQTEEELEKTNTGIIQFEHTHETAIQPCWPGNKKNTKINNSEKNFKNFSIGTLEGVVGLDSSGNDAIRSGANKNFYWFHLENLKSSHCILNTEDISALTPKNLEAIASMLRDLSHLEILVIPMLFTQLKNIKGVKGAPGKVIVKKAKHLRFPLVAWKEIISI